MLTFAELVHATHAFGLRAHAVHATPMLTFLQLARQHSSSFCVCRPNMVAVLKVHVRNVENARGWSFVFKHSGFLKLDFVASYYDWTKLI